MLCRAVSRRKGEEKEEEEEEEEVEGVVLGEEGKAVI